MCILSESADGGGSMSSCKDKRGDKEERKQRIRGLISQYLSQSVFIREAGWVPVLVKS